ncbi:hypothetical protein [Priestia megaterium]|uniref:hypothetical protein n=1 Tax=Priestia megaterium TaxID=1404 RepID=UPI00211CF526|nr:hypothetical protein [Priestia megaterium]NGY76018.1 hypothetical protein [Priestia megaterium]NGY76120.1 hypothetical protein [Priestia megaterium]
MENIYLKVSSHQEVKYSKFSIPFSSWYTLFDFIDLETKKVVKDLLAVKESLDSEMMMLLTYIENCAENDLNFSEGIILGGSTLEFYARGIHDYRKSCEKIADYVDENYKSYRKEFRENSVK